MKNLSSPKKKHSRYGEKLPENIAKFLLRLSIDDWSLRSKQARLKEIPFDIKEHDQPDDSRYNQPKEVDYTTRLMSCLSEKEINILFMRHGFINNTIYTLVEVGLQYGESRERVRQIEAKALEKIRQSEDNQKILKCLKCLSL